MDIFIRFARFLVTWRNLPVIVVYAFAVWLGIEGNRGNNTTQVLNAIIILLSALTYALIQSKFE